MNPVDFDGTNAELIVPEGAEQVVNDLAYVEEILPLKVWTDDNSVVSCWKMTWRERLSALLFGRVWLSMLGGRTPPVYIQASREFFEDAEHERP